MFMGGHDRMLGQETAKPQSTGATLKRFWTYFNRYRLVLLLVGIFVVVGVYMQVRIPNLIGQAVDCYLTPAAAQVTGGLPGIPQSSAASTNCSFADVPADATVSELIAGFGRIVLLIVALYVGSSVLGGLQFYAMSWAGQHALRNIRVDLFKHLHRLTLGYYATNEVGDLMSRITNDTDTIQQVLNFALVHVVQGVLLLVWISYSMLTRSVAYTLVSLAMTPLVFLATWWFSSQARKAFRQARVEIGAVNTDLQENISAVREVQAFGREDENIEQFRQSNAANRDANIRAASFTSALGPALEAMGYVSMAIVAGVGGLAILGGGTLFGATISLGLVIAFLNYVQRFNQPIAQISVLWTNIQSAVAGGERIFGLMDVEPDIADSADAVEMPPIEGRVVFENVHFHYKTDESVLNGIDLSANPGETVAIVGPTGAGKTTIIRLIPRFYDATEGRVLIDDLDVRDVTRDSLRSQIGIVLQDTFLFSESVLENIRYGRPDATDEEVMAAARLAKADTFVERLPDKYDTVLGERGSGLSQGQRQLLSIARAALADPRILILDEATSSVDTRTERLIQGALEELLSGRTSFVIAHRLSTIRNADQVLVLDEGKILERGTHDELMAASGFYHDLYMSQFRYDAALASDDGREPKEIKEAAELRPQGVVGGE
jgi:ATP-binding cassette subfamily B multidrug efflux pump